jgi:aminopeptidase YwaD
MGEHKVDDMNGYMDALSKFKKGDTTVVKFKRGEELMETTVNF